MARVRTRGGVSKSAGGMVPAILGKVCVLCVFPIRIFR